MNEKPKKTMSVEDLTAYMDDLIRMDFVTQYKDRDGTISYKLTELGRKAGIKGKIKKG